MALKPEHRQEEWYQQMINAATGKYLPSITAQDVGKVLTVENDGSWGVENVPTELPAVETTDKDKYLHTNASTGAVEWADAPTELPAVTDVDEGKVLTVNNSGAWGAQNPKFVVTLTLTSESGGVADKTNAEIAEAVESGKSVWFTGNMGGMVGSFPLKAVTYLTGYEYPFIGTEFDMITMNTTTISATSKYMVAMSGSDTPNNVFAMKAYSLDTPSANGVSF